MPPQAVQRYGPLQCAPISAADKLNMGHRITMDVDCTPIHAAGLARMAEPTPIVFVVDDDISVRESLELLIRYEGWQTETFSSAQEFLDRPRAFVPNCLVLDVSL